MNIREGGGEAERTQKKNLHRTKNAVTHTVARGWHVLVLGYLGTGFRNCDPSGGCTKSQKKSHTHTQDSARTKAKNERKKKGNFKKIWAEAAIGKNCIKNNCKATGRGPGWGPGRDVLRILPSAR